MLLYQSHHNQSQTTTPHTLQSETQSGSQSEIQSDSQSNSQTTPPATPPSPIEWNPGTIADDILLQHYSTRTLKKLRSQFELGQIIHVSCGTKPIAHFHTLSLILRFLVPQDLRYTHCDCNEAAPCNHVPLAVWAFRQLASDRTQGLITTEAQPFSTPIELFDELEQNLLELTTIGIAGMNSAMRDRWVRLEKRCRLAELIWIAETLVDLIQTFDAYQSHDAQFDMEQVLQLVSELWIRSDALRNYDRVHNPIPQLFIRGSAQDTTTAIGAARLVGLGCGVTVRSKGVTLTAYLQDVDSGTVMAMPRSFANPDSDTPSKPFCQLAQQLIRQDLSLGAIGGGQLLIQGGKRTPRAHLIPGRAPMRLATQAYDWETLRSPLKVDAFSELRDRLQDLPPPELRPRRVTEQLHVLKITDVQSVEFDPVTQAVRAIVVDSSGMTANLVHPYFHRGRFGVEALLIHLHQSELQFVSAHVSVKHHGEHLTFAMSISTYG